MEGDSCLQMQRVWQRLGEGVGPSGVGSPSQVGRGLCQSPIQGWALCLPQSTALPHICTPPAATWQDRRLLPGLGCQGKLLNKAFAKSTPCSSGSPWLIGERPNLSLAFSLVFLDNVSSPSSLTHTALFQATCTVPHTCLGHCSVPAALFYTASSSRAFAVAAPPPPAPHTPPPLAWNALLSTNPNGAQPSASRSRRIALAVVLAPVLH